MKQRLDLSKIVVVDVEATCWDEKKPNILEFQSEIIEIGVCVLDLKSGSVTDKQSIMVKPLYSKVSEFCTKLTTLTQDDVDKGMLLSEACDKLRCKYNTLNYVWASYGDYDRNKFDSECRLKGVEYPFSHRHINVKNLFAIMWRLEKEVGLPEALKILGLTLDGTHHRGHDDAWNIAKVAAIVLK